MNGPDYAAPEDIYDDDAAVQQAPCDGTQTSYNYNYAPAGGQTYVYNGQPYPYGAYNGYGRQPSYNYVPVRRPYYYGRHWRPGRWNHGYRVIVPPRGRW